MLRALCLALGLLPGAAQACDGTWRLARAALGAAGLELSEADGDLATAGGQACRVRDPALDVRRGTRMTARAVTWRTGPRKGEAPSLLVDIDLRGLRLRPGPDDAMAAHLAGVLSLDQPTDLALTLTWFEPVGRIELRSRGGSPLHSIWIDATLSGTSPPDGDVWWSGLETASLDSLQARLRLDGALERAVLALLALDRLRGDGDPAQRLAALRAVVTDDIAGLPSASVDPVSRSALSAALDDIPGGRGTLELSIRWMAPQALAVLFRGALVGGAARGAPPRLDVGYQR